jgi:ATP-dependent exoDNAse (exonuclease V) beta subunit
LEASNFKIYNASAGSGKTYTLVKEYIKIILAAPNKGVFKNILAITFTNKAVNEMKTRIVAALSQFSNADILENPSSLSKDICADLQITPQELHDKAKASLAYLLHNYAFFDVVTIDKFNHRLIRTFARDLQLAQNFEVELDAKLVLQQAVDNLLSKTGSNELLTQVLLEFVIDKIDDDKSWNIAYDLNEIAKLLTEENHLEGLERLTGKTLTNFIGFKSEIRDKLEAIKKELKTTASAFFTMMEEQHLIPENFKGKYIPNYFTKVLNETPINKFDSGWQLNIETEQLYTAKLKKNNPEIALIIDGLQPTISSLFYASKQLYFKQKWLLLLLKSITPLSVLKAIQEEVNLIKKEENSLLISDFNKLISNTIKNQPAPFIYERIGEKYRHYFIDEFQDTSQLQWENLVPLIGNALESEDLSGNRGSLLLVGDAKQAIYRWRGGKAEQFIKLFNKTYNPFYIEASINNLPANYRSQDQIVTFNNAFFKSIAPILSNESYQNLFSKYAQQETNNYPGGYVSISFIEDAKVNETTEMYVTKTLEKINEVRVLEYSLSDICILVNKNAQGVAVAEYLTENEIPVISSEALLLKNNSNVRFLIDLLGFSVSPSNKELRAKLLLFLADKNNIENKHSYLFENLSAPLHLLFSDFNFHFSIFNQLPLFEALVYAIDSFALASPSDAYLQYFLEEIQTFTQNHKEGTSSFLQFWEQKKERLSIVAPQTMNAVQIMTVHKAKGLEFPVVIYPFADTEIKSKNDAKLWVPLEENKSGFSTFLVNKNKSLLEVNKTLETIVKDEDSKVELDLFNVLYVALTRAVNQLHIISKLKEGTTSYTSLFLHYLKETGQWNNASNLYSFGKLASKPKATSKESVRLESIPFMAASLVEKQYHIVTRVGMMWDTKQQEAIEKGDLLHGLLSKIIIASDVEEVVFEAVRQGTIAFKDKEAVTKSLLSVVHHQELIEYFSSNYEVKTEQAIFSKTEGLLRPDRINIRDNQIILIDYKTGKDNTKYIHQLNQYTKALEEMNFSVVKKILVFINKSVSIKYI